MLEKVSEMSERAATNVSRRQFLGRFGSAATGAAAALGAFLAFPGLTAAGRKPRILCSDVSSYLCVNHYVGSKCGGRGHCRVYEGTNNECYCRSHGGGPGRRR